MAADCCIVHLLVQLECWLDLDWSEGRWDCSDPYGGVVVVVGGDGFVERAVG